MILVIGDIILDSYCIGEVTRISPEAPVPILCVTNEYDLLGGAANVANGIKALYPEVTMFGLIGNDLAGNKITDMFQSKGIDHKLLTQESLPTISKTRVISGGYQLVRIDREEIEIDSQTLDTINKTIMQFEYNPDYIVLSDYGKGLLTHEVTQNIITGFTSRVIIDPKGKNWSKYDGAYLITPNIKEVEYVLGLSIKNTDEQIEQAIRTLKSKFDIQNILITRSEKGMTLFHNDSFHHLPAKAQKVFDVTGAGDTVVAVITSYLAKGHELLYAIDMANYAAGIAIANIGAYTVSKEELFPHEE